MRDSATPISLSALVRVSLSNSLMPVNSTAEIAGRSSTITTSTLPSVSTRTSLKKPVAYSALIASLPFSSVNVSPTLTGR